LTLQVLKKRDRCELKLQKSKYFTWYYPGPVGRNQTSAVRHLRWSGIGGHDADLLEVGRLAVMQQARAASGRGRLRVRGLASARDALHQPHGDNTKRRRRRSVGLCAGGGGGGEDDDHPLETTTTTTTTTVAVPWCGFCDRTAVAAVATVAMAAPTARNA